MVWWVSGGRSGSIALGGIRIGGALFVTLSVAVVSPFDWWFFCRQMFWWRVFPLFKLKTRGHKSHFTSLSFIAAISMPFFFMVNLIPNPQVKYMKEKAGNTATLQDIRGVPCNRLSVGPEKSQKRKERVLSKKPTCQEKKGRSLRKWLLLNRSSPLRKTDRISLMTDRIFLMLLLMIVLVVKTQICFCAPV